jgi:hypothetical protein
VWKRIIKTSAITFGALALVSFVPFAYGLYSTWIFQILSTGRLIGPDGNILLASTLQYAGYYIMGILLFRYFSRIRPFAVSIDGESFKLTPSNRVEFWIPLIIALILLNLSHLGGIQLPTLVCDITLLSLLYKRYSDLGSSNQYFLYPFVLFLRPFESFSDRALLPSILNALPSHLGAIFLVPRRESLAQLDAFRLGLAGLKFREPSLSAPVSLTAEDSGWKACVQDLIQRSSLIFIDTTRTTPALEEEIRLIRELGASDRTIVCRVRTELSPPQGTALNADQWRAVVEVKKRLRLGRIILALPISFGGVILLYEFLLWAIGSTGWALKPIISLLILCFSIYWFVVHARLGISGAFVRQVRKIVSGPSRGRSYWPSAVFAALSLLLAVQLFRAAGSSNVVVGQLFDIDATITVVDETGGNSLSREYAAALQNGSAADQWFMFPQGEVSLQVEEAQVLGERDVAWFDPNSGYKTSHGIAFHIRGKGRVPHLLGGGRAQLYFRLRRTENKSPAGPLPEVLDGPKPQSPWDLTNEYVWGLEWWQIHPSRGQAIRASLYLFGRLILAIGLPIAFVPIGWKVMKG